MYEQLKELMGDASIFYGPMTREEAFAVPVRSYATQVGNDWYAGTNVEVEALEPLRIPEPPAPEEPPAE